MLVGVQFGCRSGMNLLGTTAIFALAVAAATMSAASAQTKRPGRNDWVLKKQGVACSGNSNNKRGGGNLEQCKSVAFDDGFPWVVWYQNECYPSKTCDSTYVLANTDNWHNGFVHPPFACEKWQWPPTAKPWPSKFLRF